MSSERTHLSRLHTCTQNVYPDFLAGLMTKDEFIFLATDFLPNPDLKIFASKIFHLYDKNGNGFLDFTEFSCATDNLVRQG